MLNQIVTSALWQTVGVLIAIIGTAISAIFAIHREPRFSNRPKTKRLLDFITVSLTVLLIGGTSYVSYMLSASQLSVVTKPSPTSRTTVTTPFTSDTLSPTATVAPTVASSSSIPSPTITTPTPTLSTQSSYSYQPPMCDKKEGQWNLQGIAPINCEAQAGTTPLIVNDAAWGYLYMTHPKFWRGSSSSEAQLEHEETPDLVGREFQEWDDSHSRDD